MRLDGSPDRPDPEGSGRVRLAAVGDLLLSGELDERLSSDSVFAGVKSTFATCDLVVGNLECTLPGPRMVGVEPRVIAGKRLMQSVIKAQFDAVCMANNHTFDCYEEGFNLVVEALDDGGIARFGAGENIKQASSPAIIERNGLRIAFVAGADARTGPHRLATETAAGVNALEVDRLADDIRRLRQTVHHVIVSLHWGQERLNVPSPQQIQQAQTLVDAGATMILGHHPHVISGWQMHQGAGIIYSLGNFVASDVRYSNGDCLRWNRRERTGCILLAELRSEGVREIRQVPTFDPGLRVRIDESNYARRCIEKANIELRKGITARRYRRKHFWITTARPTIEHLAPNRLIHLRPRHFKNALIRAMESARAG